jgi:hypothetical protein
VYPLMRYPFQVGDAPFEFLVDMACIGGPDVDKWKTRMVGEPLDPAGFCALLESLIT